VSCGGSSEYRLRNTPLEDNTIGLSDEVKKSNDALTYEKRKKEQERKDILDNLTKVGSGKFIYDDGSIYIGEWINRKRHGQGTMTFSDGTKYVGAWLNDYKEGQGTLYDKNGNVLKQGLWTMQGFNDDILKAREIEKKRAQEQLRIDREEAELRKKAYEEKRKKEEKLLEQEKIREEERRNNEYKKPFYDAKIECETLGFKVGGDKFLECVIELTK